MTINGIIHSEVEVSSYYAIRNLCKEIGLVDDRGNIIVKIDNGNVLHFWYDEWDDYHEIVLYDQPFDVKYSSTLLNLYTQTCEYLELPEEIRNKVNNHHGDYRVASKLELKRW
jgi:hypothetical protein